MVQQLFFMELKYILEVLLFSSQKPLSVAELRDILNRAADDEDATLVVAGAGEHPDDGNKGRRGCQHCGAADDVRRGVGRGGASWPRAGPRGVSRAGRCARARGSEVVAGDGVADLVGLAVAGVGLDGGLEVGGDLELVVGLELAVDAGGVDAGGHGGEVGVGAGAAGEEGGAEAADELVRDLTNLSAAPVLDPYNGPAILMEEAAGVFFHETVGHRLEGERQLSEQEGRTFKGQLGRRVLPEFLTVTDDPTLATSPLGAAAAAGQGTAPQKPLSLNGYYRFDDEGVPAMPVKLIKSGILRDYLKSRTPVPGSLRSNGHGRAEGTNDPIGRMANLLVQSDKTVPMAALKAQLLAEVQRQGKPYGLIIRDILGGSTNTANFGTQSFRGQPTMVYRVDAKTGAETLVRGVEMVGTPLSSVAKIAATSDTLGVFNGYCGAESGMVPVSTVAPAVLFTEIELQRVQHASERPPILPAPWRDTATKGPAPRPNKSR